MTHLQVGRRSRERRLASARELLRADELHERSRPVRVRLLSVRVYAIIDIRSSPDHPLSDAVETFLRREDAERFIEKVRGEAPDLARYLRIEECEPEAGGTRR